MNVYNKIISFLEFTDSNMNEIFEFYNEDHRHYHNSFHIIDICEMIFNDKSLTQYETGIYTALFHDIIYNPKRNDNELKSSEYFRKFNSEHNIVSQNDEKIICHIINETDYKNLEINDMDGVPKSLVKRFMEYDLASFKKPFSEILSDEKKIRKEYQIVYYNKGYIYPSINMYVPECFVIYHKGLELRTFIISYNLNKEEAMLNAKDYLLKHVIDEYRYLKVKKNNPEKVWYNQ